MDVRGKRGRSVNGEIRKDPEVIAGFGCLNCNLIFLSQKWRKIMRYHYYWKIVLLSKYDTTLD